MKKILLMLSLVMVTTCAMAVPAKPGLWKTLKLTDGTEVRAMLCGDENGHFWRAADGTAYQSAGDELYRVVDAQALTAKAQARRSQANAQRVKRLPRRTFGKPTTYLGKKKALILLVDFKNTKFNAKHNNELYQRIANEEGYSEGKFKGSMADYFKKQSMGKFELEFDAVGPITVSKDASYYGQNDSDDNDMHPGEMVIEAVTKAKELVTDWTQYDWDDDGEVDQVYLVYAGKGEADGGAETTIWPHAYSLREAKYYGDGTGPVTVATDLIVDTYACGAELDGQSYSAQIAGIGTMCHEFSHCLGYPDFYDTDYSGGQGMGYWDLMDSGSYNGDGYQPAGYTSYERWFAGWIEPTVLEDQDVNVTAMKSLQSSSECYIIYNKRNRNEYFMLENRQFDGWDASLPGKGLLILHVDYDASAWESNTPNDVPSRQRLTWIAADNKYDYQMWQGSKYFTEDGMQTDTYPYGTNNAFNKNSTPAAKFNNKNSDNTYYLSSSVEAIKQNSDGTIAFNFVANYTGEQGGGGDDPYVKPDVEGALFYESFDQCADKGGNDGEWNGQIANGDFLTDNSGWSSNAAYGADQCAKFGNSRSAGQATSPAFAINNKATLTFRAGAWNSARNDGTTLNLSVTGGTISPTSVTMTRGDFNDFEAVITGSGNVSITFTAQKGRFFLDEVLVKGSDSDAIEAVWADNNRQSRIYTIDGRYAGTDMNVLPRGLYIINGKKVVR